MSTSKPTFNPLPAWSEPFCITPEERVRHLRSLLLDESQEYQRKNILFLIHLYETGQLKELRPGKITWIFDGKIVDGLPKEIPPGSAVWAESIHHQFMQTTQTPQHIQMSHSASYGHTVVWNMHEPDIILDSIMNDTGSDVQTIFTTDLAFLGYNPYSYAGRLGGAFFSTASGGIFRERIVLEMQIIKADGTAVSPWFEEIAVITTAQPGFPQPRLSGNAMRNYLYFATAPGNSTLYVAQKKNGIISQLPVI
ncbi:hypothetical protein POJ06DRAFT_302012 [Lipomyces tetrasporus]|uniref:Uncharacterized protein n=1 Tax=Lipomyces tetrasporus TaxID=54092 RepID=A0AAD7QPC2_9ASCO|nr:uncharacterized protein POJ06DRAFT_302012 [Lipomyces tetrasporus]KAJ8099028.1 hypothetical protein POJ06DRAFT_302012 [Lipomyces tetrasporus]